jgi:hypothetical protein
VFRFVVAGEVNRVTGWKAGTTRKSFSESVKNALGNRQIQGPKSDVLGVSRTLKSTQVTSLATALVICCEERFEFHRQFDAPSLPRMNLISGKSVSMSRVPENEVKSSTEYSNLIPDNCESIGIENGRILPDPLRW